MRIKGVHDIKTMRDSGIRIRHINVNIKDGGRGRAFRPHVWTFTTKPGFTRVSRPIPCQERLKVEKVEEPPTKVVKEADEITVIVSLPGVKEEDIKIDVEGDVLSLSAETGKKEKLYTKELLLSWVVDGKNMEWSYGDELLELKLRKSEVT